MGFNKMASDISLLQSNTKVSFKTDNPNDVVNWSGVVVGLDIMANLAKTYGDLQTFHAGVKQVNSSLTDDYTTLMYFLLNVTDNDTNTVKTYAFAKEWITAGTFTVESNYKELTLICAVPPGITTDNVINILKANNIVCSEKK